MKCFWEFVIYSALCWNSFTSVLDIGFSPNYIFAAWCMCMESLSDCEVKKKKKALLLADLSLPLFRLYLIYSKIFKAVGLGMKLNLPNSNIPSKCCSTFFWHSKYNMRSHLFFIARQKQFDIGNISTVQCKQWTISCAENL